MTSHLQMSTQSGNGRHHHLQRRAMKAGHRIYASPEGPKVVNVTDTTASIIHSIMGQALSSVPQHISLPQQVSLPEHVNLPQHDAMSTCPHASLPEHVMMSTQKHVSLPEHVNLPQHDDMSTQQHVSLPRHLSLPENVATSTREHVRKLTAACKLTPPQL